MREEGKLEKGKTWTDFLAVSGRRRATPVAFSGQVLLFKETSFAFFKES
jgi:hypothetical protein